MSHLLQTLCIRPGSRRSVATDGDITSKLEYSHHIAIGVYLQLQTPERLNIKAVRSFETSGSTNPVKQRYVPQDLNPQQNRAANLKLANGSVSNHQIFS
jgi:hypothetical protein